MVLIPPEGGLLLAEHLISEQMLGGTVLTHGSYCKNTAVFGSTVVYNDH